MRADDYGWIESRFDQQMRQKRGGRALAVCASDRYTSSAALRPAKCLRICHRFDSERQCFSEFRMVGRNCGGKNNQVNLGRDRTRRDADQDWNSSRTKCNSDIACELVTPANSGSARLHHEGKPAGTASANSNEMDGATTKDCRIRACVHRYGDYRQKASCALGNPHHGVDPYTLFAMANAKEVVRAQVLIVDDESDHAQTMAEALHKPGHICTIVGGRQAAEEELRHGNFDVVVTDLSMETPRSGMEVLGLVARLQPHATTIMVTAHGDIPTAKEALRAGAYDFIVKPLDLVVFRNLVQRAAESVLLRHQNESLRGQVDAAYGFEGIIGESAAIRQVITSIRQVAPTNIPVLICGESGTGKELVAQAINQHSKRRERRFVPFNAAGQAESLLEDQLFGHVRGAYTGADKDREGVFEYGDRGTVFLDEIGDTPLSMQPKLLRVLEKGEIVRLGSNDARKVDVRFVSATNRDLRTMIKQGQFREDLFYRLRGVEITIPPLRERREDIPMLVRHAAGRFARELDRPIPTMSEPAMLRLVAFDWPGNVRELMNIVHRMMVGCTSNALDVHDVPAEIHTSDSDDASVGLGSLAGCGLGRLEKEAIRQTLAMAEGNRERAAQMLGIGERTLYRKLKEYGLR